MADLPVTTSNTHYYILKQVKGQLMLDSLPRYQFIEDGVRKEKRTIVSGMSYTIVLELFDEKTRTEGVGRPDYGDKPLDNQNEAIEHNLSWYDPSEDADDLHYTADTLTEWYTGGEWWSTFGSFQDPVRDILYYTYYYAVPTAPGPDLDGDGVGEPPENTEWLKWYEYPEIDIVNPGNEEGVDYVSVPGWRWRIDHTPMSMDRETGKVHRHVVLKGKWKYLTERDQIEVEL